ncbi:MAG: DMT family transporter [Candidatus Lokiarchaeota archaeon]|nr:DMT family transporter [Candidatus Lokiarchaeota archaeon]
MENYNLKKGAIFASISIFTIGLQPVISNARPRIIDPYLFGAITALIEAVIILPIFILERHKLKKELLNSTELHEKYFSLLNGWKKKVNIKVLIIIGLSFSVVPILLYIGYELAGAIISSLTMKSEIIFALIFGFLLLKEKITKMQIVFCFLLFFGLIIAITGGSFNLLEFNLGVFILLLSVVLFTFVHALTKISFERNELFSSQVVFLRNFISGILLTITYFLIFPLENIFIVFNPNNLVFFLVMGLDYSISLFLWYKALTYIQIGKASIIISLTPVVSAFFSFLFLGEIFTISHLIGTIIIMLSIWMIMKEKNEV